LDIASSEPKSKKWTSRLSSSFSELIWLFETERQIEIDFLYQIEMDVIGIVPIASRQPNIPKWPMRDHWRFFSEFLLPRKMEKSMSGHCQNTPSRRPVSVQVFRHFYFGGVSSLDMTH
jgi:hypothetical protein